MTEEKSGVWIAVVAYIGYNEVIQPMIFGPFKSEEEAGKAIDEYGLLDHDEDSDTPPFSYENNCLYEDDTMVTYGYTVELDPKGSAQ